MTKSLYERKILREQLPLCAFREAGEAWKQTTALLGTPVDGHSESGGTNVPLKVGDDPVVESFGAFEASSSDLPPANNLAQLC